MYSNFALGLDAIGYLQDEKETQVYDRFLEARAKRWAPFLCFFNTNINTRVAPDMELWAKIHRKVRKEEQ